jgi:hypothetical protein
MESRSRTNLKRPVVVIFAESGPLAGDLAAVLSSRFELIRSTNLAGVQEALAGRPAAMIVLVEDMGYPAPGYEGLLNRALEANCRIIVIGDCALGSESHLASRILLFPQMPSPAEILAGLDGLDGLQAAAEG